MQLETPAAQAELKLLEVTKVGDMRQGVLFPALVPGVDWICTATGKGYWEFDGRFFGQPLCHAVDQDGRRKLTLGRRP